VPTTHSPVSSKLGVVDRFDLAAEKLQASLRRYKYAISIAFSQNGRFFCAGGHDAIARGWDLDVLLPDRTGEETAPVGNKLGGGSDAH
jgi:hypothetical protein